MPATDPQGKSQYWFKGLVFEGLQKVSSPPDAGARLYWFNGMAYGAILGTASGSSAPAFAALTLAP